MVIGLTVVSLGTSAPELVVTVQAALGGYPEIAVANVVGSNIANVLLVLAIPALIYPLGFGQASARSDSMFMLLVSALFFWLCFDGQLSRADGFIMLAGLILFLALQARAEFDPDRQPVAPPMLPVVLGLPTRRRSMMLLIVVGAAMLPLGASLLLDGAVGFGGIIGVSNQVMGLTVIALSTSVPELATTLVAAFKKESDLAVGNIIGSNILNIVGIMGVASMVSLRELTVPARFTTLDLPLMVGGALIVTVLAFRRGSIGKRLGGVMLGVYVLYVYLLYATVG